MSSDDAEASTERRRTTCFDALGLELDAGHALLANAGYTLDPHDSFTCRNPELALGETKNECGGVLSAGDTVCETWIASDPNTECNLFSRNAATTFCAANLGQR